MGPDTAQDRFDKFDHWPFFDDKPSRSLCKIKDCQNRTHVFCQKCQVHLCLNQTRNCFYQFHQRNIGLLHIRKKTKISPKLIKSLDEAAPKVSTPVVAIMQPVMETSNRAKSGSGGRPALKLVTSSHPARQPPNSEKPTFKGLLSKKYSLRSTSDRATRASTDHDIHSNISSNKSAFFRYLNLKRER